mmetsp:Transcript_12572/g.19350  ORF Transcript_12572/g.19350 Transcript_12572/m.19350 type:complete len:430 (+) Transcript_12572:118-1407(+)|eukprot:CAMPEP_0178916010 /NCGR_PEP_ID=MMETSP0786-20121207/12376_1 /TAXON_ID=186022 /ORGANISM="Thalassionema frauenfeldii, Strain CCMP 1798" /LENGTH=429 /DNA_ID=CAMNT_0020589247 /DNA_START=38 /DNA_END=1327 /DNA_ORIENTATION=-
MSKPFDYSKWDNIELSDDEDDLHPNIDKESWFRMKHRSRVEREANEDKETKKILDEISKANQRVKVLEHDLLKLDKLVIQDGDEESDDDDLDDREGLEAEIQELKKANKVRQDRLDEIEKNKKWNVDNMCHVAEERTIINKTAESNYTTTGYAKSKDEAPKVEVKEENEQNETSERRTEVKASETKPTRKPDVVEKAEANTSNTAAVATAPSPPQASRRPPTSAFDTYHEFTEKYADIVEEFMHIQSLDRSKDFLIKNGDILLQENASNYLLLASLEDEMNGYREKMKLTCRQSQLISNITELAKSMQTHPGNVIIPFFQRLEQKAVLDGFQDGVQAFCEKIIKRAVTKKAEMQQQEQVDLADVPREERLGPGGLDPLEVIETLPIELQKAFESRDVDQLREVLMAMDPADAERHMKRCVDSGLWMEGN